MLRTSLLLSAFCVFTGTFLIATAAGSSFWRTAGALIIVFAVLGLVAVIAGAARRPPVEP